MAMGTKTSFILFSAASPAAALVHGGFAALLVAAALTCPQWALAQSGQRSIWLGGVLLAQKSVLDDFDEEEEEKPLSDTPPASDKAPAGEEPAAEEAPGEEETPAEEAPAGEEPPMEDAPDEEEPAIEDAPESEQPQEPSDPQAPSLLDRLDEEEEAPLRGGRQDAPRQREPGEDSAGQEEPEEEPVCDYVDYRREPGERLEEERVVLFTYYLGRQPSAIQRQMIDSLQRYTGQGKMESFVKSWMIEKIYYYEERMGEKAANLVGLQYEEQLSQPGCPLDFSDERIAEAAKAAEQILITALAEHDSAIQRRLRRGPEWNLHVRQPLAQARLNLRLNELDHQIEQGLYQEAEAECDRLTREYAQESLMLAEIFRRVEQLFKIRADAALAREDYASVRELLDQWGSRSPGEMPPSMKAVRDDLVAKAAELARQAEARKDSPHEALDLLAKATEIWPPLGQIDVLRREMDREYPILHCAYSELPRNLAPMSARSAVERHAVGLIFESLVRWVDDPQTGAHYACQLAARRPEPLARGRDFQLRRTSWSDSNDARLYYCTVEDVRRTLQLLRDPACPGYSPAWSQLFAGVENAEEDPFRAVIELQRDHWQPLSLMDFKVLPGRSFRSGGAALEGSVEQFSLRPVGTGPYQPAEEVGSDAAQMRFIANPYYCGSQRPGIREIVFHRMDAIEAEEQFMSGKIHLIYGVPKEQVSRISQAGKKVVRLRPPTVTFLAPNHRIRILENEYTRLAVAWAIGREAILEQYFRPGGREGDHAELSGPFPADSWACDPAAAPFSQEFAQAHAIEARRQLRVDKISLRLAYPAGNPDVESACKRIVEDVAEKTGIELTLQRLEPERFYDQITRYHDFDLAYWSHTYEDSTFWIEPLLDPDPAARAPGGPNFIGYVPDDILATLFRDLKQHKQFREIERLTHDIHEHVARQAVVIPLWQLDTYVAVSDRLESFSLDPLTLFGDVEKWTIRPGPSF